MTKAEALTGHRSNVEEMAEGVVETLHQLERDLPTDSEVEALDADSLNELREAAEGIDKALRRVSGLADNSLGLIGDLREVAEYRYASQDDHWSEDA